MEVFRGRYVFLLQGNFPLREIVCLQQAKEKPSETHWLKDDETKSVDKVHGPGLTGEWVQIISH